MVILNCVLLTGRAIDIFKLHLRLEVFLAKGRPALRSSVNFCEL